MYRFLICMTIIVLVSLSCTRVELEEVTNESYIDSKNSEYPIEHHVIRVITEEAPPLNYEVNGEVVGACVEIVEEIMKELGIDSKIELLPWERGYVITESKVNTCLFSTVRTDERESLFKWVGPLAVKKYALYSMKSSDISINNLEEAKSYIVGGQKEGVTGDFLINNGFKKIENDQYLTESIQKLQSGRIDLWYVPVSAFEELVNGSSDFIRNDFEKVFDVTSAELYIAFNKDTSNEIVSKWQLIFDELYKSGRIRDIFEKHDLLYLYQEYE